MAPTIVHFTTDTLPRVIAGATASAPPDLLLPFRITADDTGLRVVSWRLDVEVDGRAWSSRARSRRLPAGLADGLRDKMSRTGVYAFDHLPYYTALDDAGIRDGRHTYVEALVPRPPAGALVCYGLTATLRPDDGGEPVVVTSGTWATRPVDPRFTRDDVRRTFIPRPGAAPEAWVLMHRRADGTDQIRVDVLDLGTDGADPARAPLQVEVDGRTVVDLAAPPPGSDPIVVPLVDLAADSVTVAVPHDDDAPPPRVTVRYRNVEDTVDLGLRGPVGETRVVFVNFAIQGLNDLFTSPDVDYQPPRTYTQVTMRDEAASYSSRPGSAEDRVGDGYAFTVDAHRRFRVPQMWAMNGGLLGLLAHDARDDLALMSAAVDEGTLVPAVAGYGAHRLPYYTQATNLDAIAFGSDALRNILGATRPVYYPDSRITVDDANVTDALRDAGMEFLVVDGGAHEDGQDDPNIVVRNPSKKLGTYDDDGRWVNWQYQWYDRCSGTKVLFIDPEMKDKLLASTEAEADRGTVHLDLRRKFLELAAQPTVRAGNLVVYSDDADKASGNGWFDGAKGGGGRRPNNQRYQAALSWIAAHPWVRAVTTDDLTDDDSVGELDLVRATDPWIEKNWRLPGYTDAQLPFGMAFDTWYLAWAATPVAWLGDTLGAISDRAERAIARRRSSGYGDELVLLARLYFTMCLHESQWSKRARIDEGAPNCRDPEDFVTAASIQTRNVHVYLDASFWAEWASTVAAGREQPGAYRDGGPVVERVAAFEEACLRDEDGGRPGWWRDECRGLQWDHDPLPNVVLYNEHALVVVDRNGGRVTHLFAMVDGRPCALSGTHKAYQFLTYDWLRDEGVQCDGSVLQNTVHTPNHSYVACDVDTCHPTSGGATSPEATFGWLYPDNFNAYDSIADDFNADDFDADDEPGGGAAAPAVTFTYGPADPGGPPPASVAGLDAALAADRAEKVAGRRGTVVHDTATFGEFGKTVRLDGRTVHIEYRGTRPGHRVANEFCVDLRAAALDGRRQSAAVDPDGRGAAVTNDAGLAVRVELDAGCTFSPALAASGVPGPDTLRLHRVMTDDLEILAPDGGDFAYRIVLP